MLFLMLKDSSSFLLSLQGITSHRIIYCDLICVVVLCILIFTENKLLFEVLHLWGTDYFGSIVDSSNLV